MNCDPEKHTSFNSNRNRQTTGDPVHNGTKTGTRTDFNTDSRAQKDKFGLEFRKASFVMVMADENRKEKECVDKLGNAGLATHWVKRFFSLNTYPLGSGKIETSWQPAFMIPTICRYRHQGNEHFTLLVAGCERCAEATDAVGTVNQAVARLRRVAGKPGGRVSGLLCTAGARYEKTVPEYRCVRKTHPTRVAQAAMRAAPNSWRYWPGVLPRLRRKTS